MTEDDVRRALKRACDEAGSQAAFARRIEVSAPYIGDVLAGKRSPGPAILDALGLVKQNVPPPDYQPKRTPP